MFEKRVFLSIFINFQILIEQKESKSNKELAKLEKKIYKQTTPHIYRICFTKTQTQVLKKGKMIFCLVLKWSKAKEISWRCFFSSKIIGDYYFIFLCPKHRIVSIVSRFPDCSVKWIWRYQFSPIESWPTNDELHKIMYCINKNQVKLALVSLDFR